MEWPDTLMFDTNKNEEQGNRASVMDYTRVIPLSGITLLNAVTTSRSETAAALKLLQGFRATGRRVVLCDTSRLVVGKQFGHEVVVDGTAQLLVSCGISGREVGIGARDAGLDLASVVVCGNPLAGGQVLASQLNPGDTVLLLGLDETTCNNIIALLESRLSVRPSLAA